MLSTRARLNGPVFPAGWVAGLAVVSAVVYALVDTNAAVMTVLFLVFGALIGAKWLGLLSD